MASAPAKTAPRPKAVLILAALAALAVTWLEAPWLLVTIVVLTVAAFTTVQGRKVTRRRRKRACQGTAGVVEVQRKLSRSAERTVPLGRAGVQPVYCGRVQGKLLLAPPRSWKTALIASWAATAPGALVATSSRGDLWMHTSGPRARHGDVYVLDADGDAGIPVNFAWDPVDGCGNPQTAIRRAGDFMAASPRDPSGRDAFHEERGARFLSYLLHAAATGGVPMREVFWWAGDALCGEPQKHLRHENAYPGWALELDALLDCDTLSGLQQSALSALGWIRDPVLSAVVNPGRDGKRLNPRRFVRDGTDSVYLIGTHREYGSFAPLFAAITADIFAAARHVAERSPGRRLATPLTLALDELMTICPVPAWQWAAVAEGYRVELIAGVQSPSQMTARWGEANAKTFRACCPVKVIGGGYDDPADLKAVSELCGTDPATGEPVYSAQELSLLRPWHALAFVRGARPVEVKIKPVWEYCGYAAAEVAGLVPELEPAAVLAEVPAGAAAVPREEPRPEIEGRDAA